MSEEVMHPTCKRCGKIESDTTYVIVGEVDPFDEEQLYWSNAIGWVSLPDADVFSDDERQRLQLPLGGKYVFAVDGCKGHYVGWLGDYNELTRDDDGYREDIEQERDR